MSEESPPGLLTLNDDCVIDVLSFLSLPDLLLASQTSKTINRLAHGMTQFTPTEIYILRRRFRTWKHISKKPIPRRQTNSWARNTYHPDLRVIM